MRKTTFFNTFSQFSFLRNSNFAYEPEFRAHGRRSAKKKGQDKKKISSKEVKNKKLIFKVETKRK
jgi:hypothetical protein